MHWKLDYYHQKLRSTLQELLTGLSSDVYLLLMPPNENGKTLFLIRKLSYLKIHCAEHLTAEFHCIVEFSSHISNLYYNFEYKISELNYQLCLAKIKTSMLRTQSSFESHEDDSPSDNKNNH